MKTYLQEFPHKIADIYVHTFSIISRGIEILELNGIDAIEWNKY